MLTKEREEDLRRFTRYPRGVWFRNAIRDLFAEIDRLREREISLAELVYRQSELNREP